MNTATRPDGFNPETDLILERYIDVPVEKVWAAWTDPELLVQWFTPAPWSTASVELDLKPGGKFNSVMRSPEGQLFPNRGCLLEIVPGRKLVFTGSLTEGFRPAKLTLSPGHECAELLMTAVVTLEPKGTGTRYVAWALHPDAENCKRHAEMGFEHGWGAALDQLVALMKTE
ncbi:MAG: SRPBCC family protein [Betaproteobacteria bacterium]|nr:SRPBCC family protein [Betaproteobacteria bacterium]